MITDYVPGAYMTHDMLHMRGGHQVSWLIDGVESPTPTSPATSARRSTPRTSTTSRSSAAATPPMIGDRTYGVFNVVPAHRLRAQPPGRARPLRRQLLPDQRPAQLRRPLRKIRLLRQPQRQPQRLRPRPTRRAGLHDAANGSGGFASFIYNRTPSDQFRLVTQLREDYFQIPYDPDPNSIENQQLRLERLRDGQHETDGIAAFSYIHTFNQRLSRSCCSSRPSFTTTARTTSRPTDIPVATTVDRSSTYGGGQGSITTVIARNTLQAGFYSFGQHDNYLFGAIFNDGSGTAPFTTPDSASGGVIEEFLSDNFKPTSWLTLIAGLRQTHFQGEFTENETDPRFGGAVRIPNWTGSSAASTVASTSPRRCSPQRAPSCSSPGQQHRLHPTPRRARRRTSVRRPDAPNSAAGSRRRHLQDPRQQLPRPLEHRRLQHLLSRHHRWRARPRLGAYPSLSSPWPLRPSPPRLLQPDRRAARQHHRRPHLHAHRLAPACDAGFNYTPVDHDQRNTLNRRLQRDSSMEYDCLYQRLLRLRASPTAVTTLTALHRSRYPNPYLPQHTTFDLSLGKSFGENLTASLTAPT
jgi:hypothetical protein